MNLKNRKAFTSKSVGTGPSSLEKKIIYRTAVSQRLWNTGLEDRVVWWLTINRLCVCRVETIQLIVILTTWAFISAYFLSVRSLGYMGLIVWSLWYSEAFKFYTYICIRQCCVYHISYQMQVAVEEQHLAFVTSWPVSIFAWFQIRE